MCEQMQRFVFDGIFSDCPAHCSVGASILAFIPTIGGLMSNSIDEIVASPMVSMVLAIAIALPSVTVLSTRLGDNFRKALRGEAQTYQLRKASANVRDSIKNDHQKHLRRSRITRILEGLLGTALTKTNTLI